MIPSFPHSLVTLDSSSVVDKIQKNSYRADFEAGPPRQAPMQSSIMRSRSVTYVTGTKDDYKDFVDWYKYDINNGNSFFLWQDHLDDEWKRVRIQNTDDLGSQPLDIKMDRWKFTLQLEWIEE